jgi:hypothetical protein|tara:strand:+ start:980 stop:2041 length:1062 start_codon:yes stop_codon:yes gene_type:complete
MAVYTGINDPSVYFHTQLYTGTGSARSVTNDGNANLQPDWLWIKRTSATNASMIVNSSLGLSGNIAVASDLNLAAYATPVSALNSDGFSVNAGDASVNSNGSTYVAWQWKVNGGTTVTNNDGSHTSSVQVNTTAGFSIVTYTGTGSSFTLGHGLGATPEIIFVKGLSDNHAWLVGATSDSSNLSKVFILNNTDASTTSSGPFANTAPTSSVYTVGTSGGVNNNGQSYISYLFRSVQGYSKIATYGGNGNADGPFIYTGFKPAWLLVKRTDSTNHWLMFDTRRADVPFANVTDQWLRADTTDAEASGINFDFVSNGIKCRSNDPSMNASGGKYLYMAFASNPFVTSDGVPTTAR